jgi:hypothetical protein
MGQLVADVTSGLSLTPFQETKKKNTNLEPWVLQTVRRTPWTVDRPRNKNATYTQNNKNTEEKRTVIHASSGIRTLDPGV